MKYINIYGINKGSLRLLPVNTPRVLEASAIEEAPVSIGAEISSWPRRGRPRYPWHYYYCSIFDSSRKDSFFIAVPIIEYIDEQDVVSVVSIANTRGYAPGTNGPRYRGNWPHVERV